MQSSALDMVRARAMGHLGKARDVQAWAIARARLMRDDAKFNSREWHDANAVVIDLEAIAKQLDGIAEAVQVPPAKPATEAAAAKPAREPDVVLGAIIRALMSGPCGNPNCETCKAGFGGTAPNGVGVTDRAG